MKKILAVVLGIFHCLPLFAQNPTVLELDGIPEELQGIWQARKLSPDGGKTFRLVDTFIAQAYAQSLRFQGDNFYKISRIFMVEKNSQQYFVIEFVALAEGRFIISESPSPGMYIIQFMSGTKEDIRYLFEVIN